MTDMIEVKVPDIGDFRDVPVIEVHVKPGDTINVEDPLVTLESDKATMDVPAPQAGKVQSVAIQVGDAVSEGSPILVLLNFAGSVDCQAEPTSGCSRVTPRSRETSRPTAC